MIAISFPATSPVYPFTHATADNEPLFWHINNAAWVRAEADAAAMAQWLYWMGCELAAVERLEGVAL